jgi:rRNA maturation RNase YbeY
MSVRFRWQHRIRLKKWLRQLAAAEKKEMGAVSFILCSDEELLSINRQYLRHDYFTDVITFDYTENNVLSGDVFISLDTVRANAGFYRRPPDEELRRVMAHGVLHLCGYRDATAGEKRQMRRLENRYLKKYEALTAGRPAQLKVES